MIRSLFEAVYYVTCLTGWSDCLRVRQAPAFGKAAQQLGPNIRRHQLHQPGSITDKALHRSAT